MKTKYYHIKKTISPEQFQISFGVRFIIYIDEVNDGITKEEINDHRTEIYAPDYDLISIIEYKTGIIKFTYDLDTTFIISKQQINQVRFEIEQAILAIIA
jgi:hypothetical protein